MTNVINFAAAAMVRRAEEVVDLLNAGHGFDHDRAARFLQAVRQGDEGEILNWLFDHGVSSDWLFFGDRAP